jgi:2-polyprenyl-6-methoxyphenol hydroxylase-like FAD-dependent oxidoreductase
MRLSDISIAIIGGGLGGLTAALSLLQAGFEVHVYERATALRESANRFRGYHCLVLPWGR